MEERITAHFVASKKSDVTVIHTSLLTTLRITWIVYPDRETHVLFKAEWKQYSRHERGAHAMVLLGYAAEKVQLPLPARSPYILTLYILNNYRATLRD